MKIKEFDCVKLKDGFEGAIIAVSNRSEEKLYLIENGYPGDDRRYSQRTVRESEIEKVTYVAPQ